VSLVNSQEERDKKTAHSSQKKLKRWGKFKDKGLKVDIKKRKKERKEDAK